MSRDLIPPEKDALDKKYAVLSAPISVVEKEFLIVPDVSLFIIKKSG
jgi:hypothetical protein